MTQVFTLGDSNVLTVITFEDLEMSLTLRGHELAAEDNAKFETNVGSYKDSLRELADKFCVVCTDTDAVFRATLKFTVTEVFTYPIFEVILADKVEGKMTNGSSDGKDITESIRKIVDISKKVIDHCFTYKSLWDGVRYDEEVDIGYVMAPVVDDMETFENGQMFLTEDITGIANHLTDSETTVAISKIYECLENFGLDSIVKIPQLMSFITTE
jgi:hypothetical protein